MAEILKRIITWYLAHINYGTVFFLMAVESSFIPFPSEIVIPPAAYLAAQGDLNLFLVILAGTSGALAGALFNYYFAFILGRKIIYQFANTRIANILLINESSILKAENYFNKHGKISTLIGRLIPAIRQLISLPAGLSKMRLGDFIVFTIIGSTIWNIILALLGYFLYTQKDLFQRYYTQISIICLIIGVFFVAYLIFRSFRRKKSGINYKKK